MTKTHRPRVADGVLSLRSIKGGEQMADKIIYGITPLGVLVFMERSKALENVAFRDAETWGDFRKKAPELYKQATSELEDEDAVPGDDAELDHESLSGDGDFLYFPEQLMLDLIPAFIQKQFGRLEESVFNGPMLSLDPRHEDYIVAALRKHGFFVQRDNALVDAVYA